MIYDLIFLKDSNHDFNDGIAYYEKISAELADKFHQELINKLEEIEQNPKHFQLRYRNIRIAHFDKFPFSIHFFIEEKRIYILKILHQKRFYK